MTSHRNMTSKPKSSRNMMTPATRENCKREGDVSRNDAGYHRNQRSYHEDRLREKENGSYAVARRDKPNLGF